MGEATRSAEAAEKALANERAVTDSLRQEKAALMRLIGALAPSGGPSDGLAVLRAAAIRREEGEPPVGDVENKKADALGVSRADLEEIVARQEAYMQREDKLLLQLRDSEEQLARARADNQRNRRMRKLLEQERKDHRLQRTEADAGEAGLSERRIADAEAVADKFKQLADEFKDDLSKLQEQHDKLQGHSGEDARAGEDGGLHKDLCILLRMENHCMAENESRLTDELLSARAECDQLREEVAQDQTEEGLDYNPATTEVGEVMNSPLSIAFEKASAEKRGDEVLSALKEKLLTAACGSGGREVGEDGSSATDVLGVIETLTEIEKQNVELRREAKLGQRRKEAAQRKITEVRALMRYVFGWDVRPEGASYLMESIYATDEVLRFSLSDANTFSLKSSAYAVEKLGDEIELYLHKQNSFPGLMAAITLGNLQRDAGGLR